MAKSLLYNQKKEEVRLRFGAMNVDARLVVRLFLPLRGKKFRFYM